MTYHFHFDLRGSTVALTDASGQVLERFQYSPYGLLLSGDASTTPFLFNGMYGVMTDVNGLYYMRARFYSPEIRRFVNQDILLGNIEQGQTLNRYAFVTGQPVSFVDPFGLAQKDLDRAVDIVKTLIPEIYTIEGKPEFCPLPTKGTVYTSGRTNFLTGSIKINEDFDVRIPHTESGYKSMHHLLETVIHEYMHSRDVQDSFHPYTLIFWSILDEINRMIGLPNNHTNIYRDSKFLAEKYLRFMKMNNGEWQKFKQFYNICQTGCTTN